ncbi:MAG: hypothetical protein A4S09_03670 [Proteobacteria bacterium SG_bin7]|nr:MAG: hypothetical protein A4S09_03670 [Proteobacteria bacterium SG_bin7]
MNICSCEVKHHQLKKIVITGGPGAGKTALLETTKKEFCQHVAVLPEAAGIIFGGGFWRHNSIPGRKAAQRAIYFVQNEIENLITEENNTVVALCDRGTLDSLAYWPLSESLFWEDLNTTKEKELSKYAAVIHLHPPKKSNGYNRQNPLRIETDIEAAEIDKRIVQAWEGHPNRFFIDSEEDFLVKITKASQTIRKHIPDCCKK